MEEDSLKRTPYCDLLKGLGGKFVDFAGFDMPVQFEGILSEHKAVRENVGLFDVSHMGEIWFKGSGALATLQNLLCNDYGNLQEGRVRYSPMLNDEGGVVDDVLVYCFNPEKYLMCVNASNVDKDFNWIQAHVLQNTAVENISANIAQLAVQGPNAIKVIRKLFKEEDIPEKNYSFKVVTGFLNNDVWLSRTGYTAEDGFEIYCVSNDAISMFDKIYEAGKEFGMKLCGLGARDTLRLEGAMPLYGHEMNDTTLATEIGLDHFIKMDKVSFIGKKALLNNQPKKQRLGVELTDRGIAREHCAVYAAGKPVGEVTSGTMSPTLGKAIAMVRVDRDLTTSELEIDVRGKMLKSTVVPLPFYKRK